MYGRQSVKPRMVFEYGCLPPTTGEDVMLKEMRRRNDLWNKLVEIEHGYRSKVRELLSVPDDPAVGIKAELDRVRHEIKARRKATRKGKLDISELQQRADDLKDALKVAYQEAKQARKKLIEARRQQLQELEWERRTAVKQVQKASGLYWTNGDDVIAVYDTARKRAAKEGKELKFHRWEGTGKIFTRYQYGLPVADVFGDDTRLQINPVDPEAWTHPQRSVRRKLARTRVRLRVTSENRSPVWVELPMVMHRPLPTGGEIRSAAIIREKVGRQHRYKLVITVALPDKRVAPKRTGGAVAIDVGWRLVPDGLRVAYWADEAGNHGQLVLEPVILGAFAQLEGLRSVRDRHFNEIRGRLAEWLASNHVPDWVREATKKLAAWRSPGRLVSLTRKWHENRYMGDEEIVPELESWLARENHLYDWEANLRDKVRRRRREEYRKFAAGLARSYGKVVLEDFDLRCVAQKPEAEDGTQGTIPADRQRTIAALSKLRLAIENACRREGAEVIRVPAMYSTVECHKCGHTEKFDAARQLYRTCPGCWELWDQDHNAALVLLKRGLSNMGAVLEQNGDIRKTDAGEVA